MNPAIYFHPDGYVLTGRQIMGRHAAGNGFLRAAVKGRGDGPVRSYTTSSAFAATFRDMVARFDPTATTEWIQPWQLDLIAQAGILYQPDCDLVTAARLRLRAGPAAYSISGVTHTLASQQVLGWLARMPTEPVMTWDALVCTSQVARSVVTAVIEDAEAQELWRRPGAGPFIRPMLPVIPLGVHCDDFAFVDGEREAARQALDFADDDVVALSAGRLSIHAKAHPYPLFRAFQAIAESLDQRLVLVFAGQAAGEEITTEFRESAARLCPSVRVVFIDGADPEAYRRAWPAADLFVSLADSIQETFGLTPLEAMAAGLPCLVSDWDGYKDTVREGIDGFRVATWTPSPGAGLALARSYEVRATDFDSYLYNCATAVAVDMRALTARLRDLVTDADLRRRMGEAGRRRARADFDWAVVYRQYQALWAEQDALRRAATLDPATRAWLDRAPQRASAHMGPFDTFASFPTHHAGPQARVAMAAPDLSEDAYVKLCADPLIARWIPTAAAFAALRPALGDEVLTLDTLAQRMGLTHSQVSDLAARLAKIDVLRLDPPI